MTYKIHYFGLPGRAEVARLCLFIGKVPYEDVIVTRESWPELKPKMPFGQVPVLETPDGKLLAQSGAIDRFCAKLGGLYPSDDWAAAKADEVSFLITDMTNEMGKTMAIQDSEEKIKARKELLAGKLKDLMGQLTKRIEESGEFVAGGKLSFADLQIFGTLSYLASGILDGVPKEVLHDYPVLKAYRNRIASHAGVKEFYEKHTDGTRPAYKPDA